MCSKANPTTSGWRRQSRSPWQGLGLERADIVLGLILKFADGIGFKTSHSQGYVGDREVR